MNSKIERLIKQFAKLPRLGSRAAQRIVLALLQDKTGRAENLANALLDAAHTIRPCPVCGVLTDADVGVCEFCRDASRANGQLCIVRDLSDVLTLEKSAVFMAAIIYWADYCRAQLAQCRMICIFQTCRKEYQQKILAR